MKNVTKKWLFLKGSSIVLIPLMIWFILSLVMIFDKDYIQVVNFFSKQPSKLLFSLFLVFTYFFSALSITEVLKTIFKMKKPKMPQTNY